MHCDGVISGDDSTSGRLYIAICSFRNGKEYEGVIYRYSNF